MSMTTGCQAIRGSAALLRYKVDTAVRQTDRATALVSQQNSESRSVLYSVVCRLTKFRSTSISMIRTVTSFGPFLPRQLRHIRIRLPYVFFGRRTRIEVWVTNKSGNYNQSRNIVSFADLESQVLANDYWRPNPAVPNPSNTSNALEIIKNEQSWRRNARPALNRPKVATARYPEPGSLQPSEYTLNSTPAIISLNVALNADEVLGVAYEYNSIGRVSGGEFSSDITVSDQ